MLYFIDIETSSPDKSNKDLALDPHRNKLDLVGAIKPSRVDGLSDSIVVYSNENVYKDLASDLATCPDITYAGHGFKFDFRTLVAKGFKLDVERYAHDTLIMAVASITKVPDDYIERYEAERRRLNAGLPKGQGYRPAKKHSLKILAPYFLGVSPFWENPLTHNDPEYVKKDVLYTKGLYDHFVPMLKKDGVWEFYNEKLMPWQRMTLEAELDGIYIDVAAMAELRAKAEANELNSLKKLRAVWAKVEEEWKHKQVRETCDRYSTMAGQAYSKIKAKTPEEKEVKTIKVQQRYLELERKALRKLEEFNYGSPAQLLWAFKEVLHYPAVNMEGDETTGASVLEMLAAQGKEDIKALLQYKEATKLISTYFDGYPALMVDGKLHCSFNLNGARTGRLSSSDPNLQQVPPGIKGIFTAAPGNVLVSQDLSAIEPALIAYYTEDSNLCRILMEGQDFHGVAAVQFELVNCEAHEVKAKEPEVRYGAKQGDLSTFYGSGKSRLYITLLLNGVTKLADGTPITEEVCARMVRNYRRYYAESWEFKQILDAELMSGGVAENLLGRKFIIENPGDVYMKGFNRLIQGSASDLLLQGTYDCLKELKAQSIWARLRLLVHDNTVLECQEKDAEYVNQRLCHHLTKFKLETKHGLIPLKVEGGYARTWKG